MRWCRGATEKRTPASRTTTSDLLDARPYMSFRAERSGVEKSTHLVYIYGVIGAKIPPRASLGRDDRLVVVLAAQVGNQSPLQWAVQNRAGPVVRDYCRSEGSKCPRPLAAPTNMTPFVHSNEPGGPSGAGLLPQRRLAVSAATGRKIDAQSNYRSNEPGTPSGVTILAGLKARNVSGDSPPAKKGRTLRCVLLM